MFFDKYCIMIDIMLRKIFCGIYLQYSMGIFYFCRNKYFKSKVMSFNYFNLSRLYLEEKY